MDRGRPRRSQQCDTHTHTHTHKHLLMGSVTGTDQIWTSVTQNIFGALLSIRKFVHFKYKNNYKRKINIKIYLYSLIEELSFHHHHRLLHSLESWVVNHKPVWAIKSETATRPPSKRVDISGQEMAAPAAAPLSTLLVPKHRLTP